MPVDPGAPKNPAPEAGGVGAGNPDLAPRAQQAANFGQHQPRVPGVLQDIGQDHHVIGLLRPELSQPGGVHRKTPLAGHRRG